MRNKAKVKNMNRQIRNQKFSFHACALFAVIGMFLLMIGCAATSSSIGRPAPEAAEAQQAQTMSANRNISEDVGSNGPPLAANEPIAAPSFPTFNNTGLDICTNEEGLPLIYMFSTTQCPHCKWAGPAYDFIVRFLASDGLIEAHHYDLPTGDDLLTEAIETEIPAENLEVYNRGNPKDLVPYYNFGCAYDRIGNGYERENDLVAEGEEMRRVIETLVQMVSGDK